MSDAIAPPASTAFALALVLINVGAQAQETPPYEVVAEYIRQLGTMNDIQKTALKELTGSTNQMSDAIRNSTRIQLELRRNIYALKSMKILNKDYDILLPSVIQVYERKIELHGSIIDIASQLVAGPQPGVDYAKLAATMPQITANLEYLDKTLYGTTPMFCLLLVDENRPNSKGNLDHLRITKAERVKLVRSLDAYFGPTLAAKDQNYTVGSASLIKLFLTKPYKSSDEP